MDEPCSKESDDMKARTFGLMALVFGVFATTAVAATTVAASGGCCPFCK